MFYFKFYLNFHNCSVRITIKRDYSLGLWAIMALSVVEMDYFRYLKIKIVTHALHTPIKRDEFCIASAELVSEFRI